MLSWDRHQLPRCIRRLLGLPILSVKVSGRGEGEGELTSSNICADGSLPLFIRLRSDLFVCFFQTRFCAFSYRGSWSLGRYNNGRFVNGSSRHKILIRSIVHIKQDPLIIPFISSWEFTSFWLCSSIARYLHFHTLRVELSAGDFLDVIVVECVVQGNDFVSYDVDSWYDIVRDGGIDTIVIGDKVIGAKLVGFRIVAVFLDLEEGDVGYIS